MADEKTFKKDTVNDLENHLKEKSKQLQQEVKEDREQRKSQTTEKLNNPTKEAKKAENEEIIAGGLQTILTGLNSIAKSKAPEFEHEEFELETIAELSAPVINKHFDIEALEHKEEAKLATYIVMCEMEKARKFLMRKKNEASQRKKQAQEQEQQQEREQEESFELEENGSKG